MKKFILSILLAISFLFIPLNARSKFDTFCGYTLLTFGVLHLSDFFKSCPYLYEKNEYKMPEEYLDFLESRIAGWQFLLGNPNEEQLNSFRSELLEHYDQIINKRGLFSSFFLDRAPYQPWALFKEEIQQHLSQLYSYKFDRFFQKTKNEMFNRDEPPIYSQELIDRVDRLEKTINKIKKCVQAWPNYQNECSQNRQEATQSNILSILNTFYCFYLHMNY